ncbi:MAG: hypothetical protein AAF587_15255 [Bacteroidota bacterium]
MKKEALFVSLLLLLNVLSYGQKNQTKLSSAMEIPMQAGHWSYESEQVEFIQHMGVQAMKTSTGETPVILKNHTFKDGTIEFDVALLEGIFVTLYFRREDAEESECFYLRTYRAGNAQGWDAVQYASIIKGITLWDLQGHYQSNATLHNEGWNHIKLVISGDQMLAYVNDLSEPALVIPKLEGNSSSGHLAVEGNAIFANMRIHADAVEGLSPKEGLDLTNNDARYLRDWMVSEPVEFDFGQEILNKDLPNDSSRWSRITAERLGLINLTRIFGGSKSRDSRRLCWLKTSIQSNRTQTRQLNLGFSDEVWVILNGQLLYVDKNYYANFIMKQPGGRCSVENTMFELPLQEGKNELLIGVGNFFYGWGIIARLDMVEGLGLSEHLAP